MPHHDHPDPDTPPAPRPWRRWWLLAVAVWTCLTYWLWR